MAITPFPNRRALVPADYVALKGGITLDVRVDYGALGDGVTDDGPAIRKAIGDALSNGWTLYFPPGIYRVASWDPAYATGSARRAINVAPTASRVALRLYGPGTILFDFPGLLDSSYTTEGIFFDGSAGGSFIGPEIEGLTFKSKNGPSSVMSLIYFQGGWNSGTCDINGTAVTRKSGPAFSSAMAGQRIAMGSLSIGNYGFYDVWQPRMQGGQVTISTPGGVYTATISDTTNPFTPAINGQQVAVNGVTAIATYVDASHVTLSGPVPTAYPTIMTSKLLHLPNGSLNIDSAGNVTVVSGDQFSSATQSQYFYVSGVPYLFTLTDATHGTIAVATDPGVSGGPLPPASSGLTWNAGGRPFNSELANRWISVYWAANTVASVTDQYNLTLGTLPLWSAPIFEANGVVVQNLRGFRVASVADSDHLTLTAPAGTALSTGAWGAWLQPLQTLGNPIVQDCSFFEGNKAIQGGGWNYLRISTCKFYSFGRDEGYSQPGGPQVFIWTNPEGYKSYGIYTDFIDCYFDCCATTPAYGQPYGKDGALWGCGAWTVSNIRVYRNTFEGTLQIPDYFYGAHTPAGFRLASRYTGITIDSTPQVGTSALTTYGIRCDASDVSINHAVVHGTPRPFLCDPPYAGPGYITDTSNNGKLSNAKFFIPSSIENGARLATNMGGAGGNGLVDWTFDSVDISVENDYSGWTVADAFPIGPFSGGLLLRNCHAQVNTKYTSGPQARGIVYGFSSGILHIDSCTTDSCDVHLSFGGYPGDFPAVIMHNHTHLGTGQRSAGRLQNVSHDGHQMYLPSPATGWILIAQVPNSMRCRLTIESVGVKSVIEIMQSAYSPGYPFVQLSHVGGASPAVTQLQVGAVDTIVHLYAYCTGQPVTFLLEATGQLGMVLLDPPIPVSGFTTLASAMSSSSTAVDIYLVDASLMRLNQVLLIDSEQLIVTALFSGGHIQANRAQNSTAAAAHSAGAAVSLAPDAISTTLALADGLQVDALGLNGSSGGTLTGQYAAGAPGRRTVKWNSSAGAGAWLAAVAASNDGAGIQLLHNGATTPQGWEFWAQNNDGDLVFRKIDASGTVAYLTISPPGTGSSAGFVTPLAVSCGALSASGNVQGTGFQVAGGLPGYSGSVVVATSISTSSNTWTAAAPGGGTVTITALTGASLSTTTITVNGGLATSL